MAKSIYKELGLSNREYEEALVLERLFKLVKKNPCSTCLLKKPTHVDLDRFELLCSTCSKRCSSKVQIGKGLISMSDLDRLESMYGKSKKKPDVPARKHKSGKSHHRNKSTSQSSYENYRSHESYDSDSSYQHRRRSHSKKPKDRYPSFNRDYPPDVYPTNVHKGRPVEHSYTYPSGPHGEYPRGSIDYHDSYPKPAYPYKLQYGNGKRDIPGMVGILAGQGHPPKDDWPIVRNEWPQVEDRRAFPPRNYDGYSAPRTFSTGFVERPPIRRTEPGALALTNGYPSIRSTVQHTESMNNNPFAKRSGDMGNKQPFNFSGMREALSLPNPANPYVQGPPQPPADYRMNSYRHINDYQPRMPPPGDHYFNKFQ